MSNQIDKNIDLAFRFLDEVADDPSILDDVGGGSTLILLPPDEARDPELSVANVETARWLAAAGRHVAVWTVGTPVGGGPRVVGRWPLIHDDRLPAVSYDRARDVLEIELLPTDTPTMPVRRNPFAVLQLDPETRYVVGVTVPRFLGGAATKSLLLFDLLLLPSARLEGITQEELRDIRNALVHGKVPEPAIAVTTERIAGELSRLIA